MHIHGPGGAHPADDITNTPAHDPATHRTASPHSPPTTAIPHIHTAEINLANAAHEQHHHQLEAVTHAHDLHAPAIAHGGHAMATSPMMLRVSHGQVNVPTHRPHSGSVVGHEPPPPHLGPPQHLGPPPPHGVPVPHGVPPPQAHAPPQQVHAPPPPGVLPPPAVGGLTAAARAAANFDYRQQLMRTLVDLSRERCPTVNGRPAPDGVREAVLEQFIQHVEDAHDVSSPGYGPALSTAAQILDGHLRAQGDAFWGAFAGRLADGVSRRAVDADQLESWGANYGAALLRPMNQTDLLVGDPDRRVAAGVCQGACYEWIREILDDPGITVDDSHAGVITANVRRAQQAHEGEGGAGVVARVTGGSMPDDFTQGHGLRAHQAPRPGPASSLGGWLHDAVKHGELNHTAGTFVVGVSGDQGGHAVGVRVTVDAKTKEYSALIYDVNKGLIAVEPRPLDDGKPSKKKGAPAPKVGLCTTLADYFRTFYGDYPTHSIVTYQKRG